MNKRALGTIVMISVLVAVVVVIVLKWLGHDRPTAIAGGVAGGVAGGISANLLKKKKT